MHRRKLLWIGMTLAPCSLLAQPRGGPPAAPPAGARSLWFLGPASEGRTPLLRYAEGSDRRLHAVGRYALDLPTLPDAPWQHWEVVEARVAPDERRLAIGVAQPFVQRALWIVDLPSGKTREVLRDRDVQTRGWFCWRAPERLWFIRSHGERSLSFSIFDLPLAGRPPSRRLTRRPISPGALPGCFKTLPGNIERAARRLDASGYRPPVGSPSYVHIWPPHLLGHTGAVGEDGAIATLVSGSLDSEGPWQPGTTGPNRFVVVRKERGIWREYGLAGMRDLWMVRFWKEWLLVGDGTLRPDPREGVPRGQGIIRDRRIRVYSRADLRLRADVPADLFATAD
jgi:hypothetical protein